jgi:hypothetical protein
MRGALVDGIARAVLYEGYLLYPYRPSAIKNRQRFNFGVLYPRGYSETQSGTDAWMMQTECVAVGSSASQVTVQVKYLRLITRTIEKLLTLTSEPCFAAGAEFEEVEKLEVNGEIFQPWQEAAEEFIEMQGLNICELATRPIEKTFTLRSVQEREAIRDKSGCTVGMIRRDRPGVSGIIQVSGKEVREGVFTLTVRISNVSRIESDGAVVGREDALAQSLISTHTILELGAGEFISLIDPPEQYKDLVEACQNIGTWPVLVGDQGQRDTLLSSPIILYDYPQVAPESPGDLFDGAEIDEILSLRILTMTEEEKREMRQSDERARQILERTETLPEEQWMKLHGALRGLRTVKDSTP